MWSKENERLITNNGLSAMIPIQLNDAHLKQYLRVMRIEQITTKLRSGNLLPDLMMPVNKQMPDEFAQDGRIVPRDVQYRRLWEQERTALIQEAQQHDYLYRAPQDYSQQQKHSELLYIPADDFAELNFIGLLIGPRGQTLQQIQQEANVRVSIRGRGSEKTDRPAKDHEEGVDDYLHAVVMGDTEDQVRRGVQLINDIIERACSTRESANDLKRSQMQELARLNGTVLIDGGNPDSQQDACVYCASAEHQGAQCPHRDEPEYRDKVRDKAQQVEADYADFLQSLGGSSSIVKPSKEEQQQQSSLVVPSGAHNPDLDMAPWVQQVSTTLNISNASPQQQQQQHSAPIVEIDQDLAGDSYMEKLMQQQMAGMK